MDQMKRSGLTDWKSLSSEHVFLLILCVGMTYRVVRWAVGMPLWGDEVILVLNFLDRSTDNVLDPLENGQVAPPVFIWAIWLIIQYLGTSEWLLRLVPTLASIAALLLMCRFAKKTLTAGQAFIAVSLLAVSYYTVRYGAELKPYSIDLLIAMIILTIGNEFRDGSNRRVHTLLLIGVLPVATFFSFPSVFVVGSVLLALCMDTIARRDIRQLTMVLFTGGLVLLLFVLNYYYYIQIHSIANSTLKFIWWDAFPPPDLLGFVSWFIEQSAGRMMAYPHGGGNYKSLLTTALVVAGIVVLWRQRSQFLLTLLVMPFLLTVMAAIFHAYPYGSSGRIAQHLAPSICILAAVGLAKVLEKIVKYKAKQNDYLRYACFVLLGFGLTGIGYTLAKPYKTIDDLEVRRIVTGLLRDYECKRIYVPNRIVEVPVNFRWYLLVSERAVFNARIEEKTGNADRTLCILYFDSNKFPVRSSTLNKHLQTLTESFDVRLDVEKSIHIYGTQIYEHSYR